MKFVLPKSDVHDANEEAAGFGFTFELDLPSLDLNHGEQVVIS